MSGPGGFATGDQKVALMAGAIDRPGHFPTATPVACDLVGHLRKASAVLRTLLGARVLIDDLGYPIGVGGTP